MFGSNRKLFLHKIIQAANNKNYYIVMYVFSPEYIFVSIVYIAWVIQWKYFGGHYKKKMNFNLIFWRLWSTLLIVGVYRKKWLNFIELRYIAVANYTIQMFMFLTQSFQIYAIRSIWRLLWFVFRYFLKQHVNSQT